MDKYFTDSSLLIFLVAGLGLTLIGLLVLNHEFKCELEKNPQQLSHSAPAINQLDALTVFFQPITSKRLS
jgi:hypothetical protein